MADSNDNDGAMPTETEFQSAFETEMGGTPSPVESTPTNDKGEGEPVTPPAAQAPVPPEDKEEKPPVEGEPAKPEGGEQAPEETAEETATRKAEEAAEEATKFATKDDVVDALREYNKETTGRLDMVKTATNQVIEKVYPQGIDRNIYDSNGNVIKTAQDIVDRGLVNERTQEPYTYEEAASFMLQAQKKMSENIEELNNWAEKVAEENINLLEGNQRVMNKWGETLKALDEKTRIEIAERYMKSLTFDETGSYITEMKMTPEEFYDTVMAPYSRLNEALAKQQAADVAAQQQQQQQEQEERTGLPRRGVSEPKANTGDPMLDAFVDELKKG